MPSDASTISIILTGVVGVLSSYAAYWAFTIRNALRAPLYRRQAQWVAVVGVYFVALSITITLTVTLNITGFFVNILGAAFIIVGFVVFFDWIDSTIRIARRSDPLLRDTLHWSKLRYFIGITSTIGLFFNVLFNVIFTASSSQSYLLLGSPPIFGFIGTILFLGAIALLVSGRRSGDLTLRRHLKWFGLGTALLWMSGQIGSAWVNIPVTVQIIAYSLYALAAFCIYRSAKSLVPLGHVSAAELASTSVSTSSTASSPPL